MILEKISKFLAVILDEVPVDPDNDCVYLLSRPCIIRRDQKHLQLYTTESIAAMVKSQNATINIKLLSANETTLHLKDGCTIKVRPIDSKCITNSVMFLFEVNEKCILFTAVFNNWRGIFFNQFTLDCIRNKQIDEIYLDNRKINGTNWIDEICTAIEFLITQGEGGYTIHLQINRYGFENIILQLAKKYRIRVYVKDSALLKWMSELDEYLDCDKYMAQVIVIDAEETISNELILENYKEEMAITVKLSVMDDEGQFNRAQLLDGALQLINYNPHATYFELYGLVSVIRPRLLTPIYTDGDELPQIIRLMATSSETNLI